MARVTIDLTDKIYGNLKVISKSDIRHNDRVTWNCLCKCGSLKIIVGDSLRKGRAVSCGNCNPIAKYPKEYNAWKNMKSRCYNPANKKYPNYGGRNITICSRWTSNFWLFLEDVGLAPFKSLSLDRRDNNGNYEPSNVKWSTAIE